VTYRTARAETFAREERGVTDETKESETESHQRHVSGGPVSPTSRQAQRYVVVIITTSAALCGRDHHDKRSVMWS